MDTIARFKGLLLLCRPWSIRNVLHSASELNGCLHKRFPLGRPARPDRAAKRLGAQPRREKKERKGLGVSERWPVQPPAVQCAALGG